MAIYSLNHKPVGKTTHAAGRAGAHVRYIARASADAVILSNEIPQDWRKAKRWLDGQEQADRSNARIIDRLMVAIPRELNQEQRIELVQDYLQEITGNDIPWFAAIHQKGKDEHNPHAHIILRDRSLINGRRVVQTSEKGSTQHFRKKWSEKANKALLRANVPLVIDHRSLKAQGIEREPTKHRGWKEDEKVIEMRPKTWVEKVEHKSSISRVYI